MVLGSTAFCRDMIQEHLSAFKTGADRNGTTQHYNNNYNPGSLVACRIRQSTILSRFLSSISMLLVPYFMYFIHSNLSRINIISIKGWYTSTSYCVSVGKVVIISSNLINYAHQGIFGPFSGHLVDCQPRKLWQHPPLY